MRRLGLDIGTNSIGWCLIEEGEAGARIVDLGVRIFSDGREPPKSGGVGKPLAEGRRLARGARRRRDRYLGRRNAFLITLKRHALMPADASEAKLLADRDPYELRARALDERLEPHEIGRALFHLNQRRGFKSNRKAERRSKDDKPGVVESAANALDEAIQRTIADPAKRTLGTFLAQRIATDNIVRVRMNSESQRYDFYPQRRHIAFEFQRIWDEQAKYHPELMTESSLTWGELNEEVAKHESSHPFCEARDKLYRTLFFQRPLKEPVVGRCTFIDEPRLRKAHPLFQERRLYEEVNHLRVTTPGAEGRPLTKDERDRLIRELRESKELAFKTLGKRLKLQPGQSFNKATANRTHLAGNVVYATLADPKRFGNAWAHFLVERQWEIIQRLLDEEDPEKLHTFLTEECGLGDEAARNTARVSLPEGYGRLGLTATRLILDELKQAVVTVSDAEQAVFGKRGDRPHDSRSRLPYYGELLSREIPPGTQDPNDPPEVRWGKITNPTVHIGLRQLEKLVNAIVAVHGRPDQIIVELARELKLTDEERKKRNEQDRRNQIAMIKRGEKLEELGQANNGRNRNLLRVWEELSPNSFLDRACPYCGEMVSPTMLFDGRAQVDHIIPFSLSYDDSVANKVVVHRQCNQAKGNKTPWQAFHKEADRWAQVTAQVALLPKNKQWRFGPDALSRFEEQGGFLARQLTDTQYLSRLATKFISSLYTSDEGRRVYAIPGRMTAMLRGLWGLNEVLWPDDLPKPANVVEKNRNDHRHHAIDAFVVGMTTPQMLNAISRAASQAEEAGIERLLEQMPEPWPGFRSELREKLARVTVSHKPDHGRKGLPAKDRDSTAGRLHNDTAYGLTGAVAADGNTPIVVHRVPLLSLKPEDIQSEARIPDRALRDALYAAVQGTSGKTFEAALANFARTHPHFAGIRRVRVREALTVIAIKDKGGRAFKAYAGSSNARFNVWRLPDGSWQHDVITTFQSHQKGHQDRRPHPAAKKVLCLRQNDLIAVERNGAPREIMRVIKFTLNGQMALVEHNEAGKLADRHKNADDRLTIINPTVSGLKKMKARQVRIDPLGRVFDPAPRA